MTEKLTHKTFSQPPDAGALYSYLSRNFPGANYHSAYEAGFCGYWIHNELKSLGINSIVVNPGDIPTTNKEKVQKEDKRDSRKIARSLRGGELKAIFVPSAKTLEDRALSRTRHTLVKDLTRYKNRIKSFLYFHGIKWPETFNKEQSHWSKRFMSWLGSIEMKHQSGKLSLEALLRESENMRGNLLAVTRQVRALSQSEPYRENVRFLTSIPGIGLITAMDFLCELETFERFGNNDHLCGLIGLIPSTDSSGEEEKVGDITPRGHRVLRNAIIESAWIAVRIDPALSLSFHNYCRRMEANQAIVRIARKLLARMRFVLKNKVLYEKSVVR